MSERASTREPVSIAQARAEVERSRARMSETLDEIEDRLVEKRIELREKLNVKKRMREHVDRKPLNAVAIAAGVGFIVGLVGRRRSRERVDADDRDELRALLLEAREHDEDSELRPISIGRSHPSFWQEARAQLVGALTAALVTAVTERFRPHGEGRAAPDAATYDEDEEEDEIGHRPPGRWPAADELD